jgi:copper chaperone CopZ
VKVASVDVAAGKAEVAYDAAKTSPDKLVAAVAGTGFSATLAAN